MLKFLSVGYDASEIRLHPCGKLLGVNHLTMKKGRENALSLVSEFRMSPGIKFMLINKFKLTYKKFLIFQKQH